MSASGVHGSEKNSPKRSGSCRSHSDKSGAFFGTSSLGASTWGGGSTGSLSGGGGHGSASAPSPLMYNSPTKRFGYPRWPPLISPVPQDWENVGRGDADDYVEVRREVGSGGHNLTSVMMDPRAPGGVSAELQLAWVDQSHAATVSASGPGAGRVQLALPSAQEVRALLSFARRTGSVMERYRQNHHAGPGQEKLYRPELLSSSQKAADGAADLAECFREVPAIFFHRDFQLSEPALFDRVVIRATPDTQERLSQYLDVVETCLLKQISSRSQHFFEALITLQDVRDRLAQACGQVLRLRSGLHDIDQKTVRGMIRIPRLAQRKVNLAALLEKLRLLQDVQRSTTLVQSLLGAGDFLGALDVLEDGQGLVREGGLATVRCTRRLARQLGEYMELVSDLLASSFIGLALSFQGASVSILLTSLFRTADPDACAPDTRSSLPSPSLLQSEHSCVRLPLQQPELDEALKAQLVPRVRGLVRLCRLSKALERYRGRLTASLKEVVKTVLTEYLGVAEYQRGEDKVGADGAVNTPAEAASPPLPVNGTSGLPTAAAAATSTEENAGLLGKGVRAMKAESFLGCLKLCFEQMLLPMTGVGLIHTFLEEQISEELSRILDRRPVSSSSLHSTHQSQGELSTGSPGETGGEGSFGHVNREPSLPPSSSPAVSNSSRTDAGSVPPSPTPSPSNKFKTFLEKRRLETGGGASKSGTSTVGSLGIGGKQQTQAPFKDEDQIKVLELQACKKLNDEILKTLCDLCYRHIVSLLVARREANVSMDLAEIKVLWDSTMSFLGAVEQISGTAGFGLKSTLLTQAKQFVEHVHKGGVGRLLAALDAERWVQTDVGAERQAEIDHLMAGRAVLAARASSSVQSLQEDRPLSFPKEDSISDVQDLSHSRESGELSISSSISNDGHSENRHRFVATEVIIGEERYKVVYSAVLLISLLNSYLNVAANFPMLAMDVMQCVVNLLRLFNTRTAQLVLGAGAIQATARLRSITAKHLALASQCLGLILVLLPHVRAALAAHLQTKQQAFLIELDRLRQEYAEHQERVLTKFVAIMGELIAHSAANTGLRETDWDALGSAACRFVEEVIKGTTTMHRVLYQILPPTQVQDIFNRVFDLLGHRLKEYLDHARPRTNAGRERLVDEVSHLVTSLSMLRGVNAQALAELEGTIREKFSPASFLSSPATTSNSPSPTSLTLCLPPTDLNGGSASHEPILTPPRTSDVPASASSA